MSGGVEWEQLHDLDKGAVLLHLWKHEQEGGPYADEHYPARFLHDEQLKALDRAAANRVAHRFWVNHRDLDRGEWGRLYDLALDAERDGAP